MGIYIPLSQYIQTGLQGTLSPDDVTRILEARDRTAAPETAPAKGLFLMKVFYEQSELENYAPEGVPFWC